MGQRQCADCRDGEHDNISDKVYLVVVRNPKTNRLVKRCYMCVDHIDRYEWDGYEVIIKK